jgi:hypothetical protein
MNMAILRIPNLPTKWPGFFMEFSRGITCNNQHIYFMDLFLSNLMVAFINYYQSTNLFYVFIYHFLPYLLVSCPCQFLYNTNLLHDLTSLSFRPFSIMPSAWQN